MDEEVVQFDYVFYLLDSLSKLNRNIKIELKTTTVTLSEPSGDPLKTFHFSVVVRAFGKIIKPRNFTFMASYLIPGSKRIKMPYVEYHNIEDFLGFLKNIFEPNNVDIVLRKIQIVKKSELIEEELDIPKIKRWNH